MRLNDKAVACICVLFVFAGLTGFAQQVGPGGDLHYTYPIPLPPGIMGMQPELSLAYNSNKGNGMCGVGWSISGIPVITRDRSYAVNFDADDHYMYNGQRLIPGGDGYYHTERESYVRIEGIDLNTANSHWIITQKNGIKMYFGYNSGDHTTANDGHINAIRKSGKALVWGLSKMEDVHGNYYYIEYNEDTDNGDYYPAKIKHTKNSSDPLPIICSVEFFYELRSDHEPRYVPTLLNIDKRLRWIVVKVDTNIVRKYKLEYSMSLPSQRSNLISIQEYGEGGISPPGIWVDHSWDDSSVVKFPAIDFTWANEAAPDLDTGPHHSNGWEENIWNTGKVFSGDINGDGKTDLIFAFNDDKLTVKTLLSTSNAFCTGPSSVNPFDGYSIEEEDAVLTGDVNGDGKTDLIFAYDDEFEKLMVKSLLSTGSGFEIGPSLWSTRTRPWVIFDWNKDRIFSGDVNGDGKLDLIFATQNELGLMVQTMYSYPNYFFPGVAYLNGWGAGIWNKKTVFAGDVNGDGQTDLIFAFSNDGLNIRTLLSTPESFYSGPSYSNGWGVGIWNKKTVFAGDVNGDGKTDLIFAFSDNGLKVRTILATSTNFRSGPTYSNGWGAGIWNKETVFTGNVNGDGKTDLIFAFYDNGLKVRTVLSKPNGFFGPSTYSNSWGSHIWNKNTGKL